MIQDSSTDTNTWRPVKVDGTQKLDNSTSGNALDLVGGTNVTLTESNGAVTISATDTTYSLADTNNNGLLRQLPSASVSTQTQSTKFLREDGTWQAPSYTAAVTIDTSLSTSSTNPVQNQVVATALAGKCGNLYLHKCYINQCPFSTYTIVGHNAGSGDLYGLQIYIVSTVNTTFSGLSISSLFGRSGFTNYGICSATIVNDDSDYGFYGFGALIYWDEDDRGNLGLIIDDPMASLSYAFVPRSTTITSDTVVQL